MKKILIFLVISASGIAAHPQLKPVYNFQHDDSLLKKSYYEEALQKQKALISSLDKTYKSDYKKIYEDRFSKVADLLQSSRSVTSPEANQYLQAVLKKITDANGELKELPVRLVFSRDWWPNAYSMGEGTLVVNAGLMVFLNNEAELVFVLCHELAHYYLDHGNKSITKYVETINSDAFQKELKRLSKEEFKINEQVEKLAKSVVFDGRRHSRENEAEADRQGVVFMKKTGYDCGAAKTCLEILDKVDDSLLYKPLKIEQLFNYNEYPFKKKWIQKESSIFSQLDEKDSPLSQKEKDSLKTHPDCSQRISLLEDSLRSQRTGRKFMVDEAIFDQLKKDFLIEIDEECYHEENLGRNLYYSLLLLQDEKNRPVAIYSVARCLNRIYERQQEHKLGGRVDIEDKRYAEDYSLLLRMLNHLKLDEIATLNYYFCDRYKQSMNGYAGFENEMNKATRYKN